MVEREPIDITPISGALNPEIAGPARVEALYTSIVSMVERNGVEADIMGTPGLVTEVGIDDFMVDDDTEIDNGKHVARAYKSVVQDPGGSAHERFGIVFDMDPDPKVVITANPHAVYFDKTLDSVQLFVDDGPIPKINQPAHIKLIQEITQELSIKVNQADTAKQQALESERQLREQEYKAELQRRKDRRAQIRSDIAYHLMRPLRFTRENGFIIGLGSGTAAVAAGIVALIASIEVEASRYEGDTAKLDGGSISTIGGNPVAPEFSEELYNNPSLDEDEIRNLIRPGSTASGRDILEADDGLLEVHLTSSNEGKNCEIREVEKVPLDSTILSWTDAVTPEGNSRADEFSVVYRTQELEVCWNGEEMDRSDDPRVIVSLRDAEGKTYTTAESEK
jgi:hypothetical protein